MPIQAPQWTDYLNCPVCCHEFGMSPRSPISLGCGHTLCKHCLQHLHRRQCPFDQTAIHVEQEELVVNTALLHLAGYPPPAQTYHPPSIQALPEHDRLAYDCTVKCMEHLAAYLKFCGNATNSMSGNRLSRPMQRKLVMLLQCAITDEEGRGRAARAVRSLGERTVTELILQHQNPQQLSANLWAAVRARGCQFLGPAMQEEVLKLVLLALEDGSALSRKVLVMFVVQRLEPHFPQASKTSIGHVVQLLYRASCFKVSKRECDSSLMQLKEEFRTYESLRREHDAQIVQIATEAGLRIAPDQWSALLYGDTAHKSHMQSIIDKLQTPQSFAQSVQELFIALQRTGDPAQLIVMSLHLDRLTNIDASLDAKSPSWQQLAELMTSLKEVVAALIHYLQQQSSRDSNHNQKHINQDRCLEPNSQTAPQTAASTPTHAKYKVAMCRDAASRAFCPRGNNCTFAHSDEEMDRYRTSQMNGNFVLVPVPSQGMPPMQPQGIQGIPMQPQPQGFTPYIAQPVMDNHTYPIPMVPAVTMDMPIPENHNMNNGHQPPAYPVQHHQMLIMNNEIMLPNPGGERPYYGHYNPGQRLPEEHRPNMQYMPELGPPPTFVPRASSAPNMLHPTMFPGPPQEAMVQDDLFNTTVMSAELLPEYRGPSTYGTVPLDRRTDAVWAPNPGDQMFNFTEMRNALPAPGPVPVPEPIAGPSSAPDGLPGQVADRRAVGADRQRTDRPDRIIMAPESFHFVGADDRELEAGLQALERQIDTEFKNDD